MVGPGGVAGSRVLRFAHIGRRDIGLVLARPGAQHPGIVAGNRPHLSSGRGARTVRRGETQRILRQSVRRSFAARARGTRSGGRLAAESRSGRAPSLVRHRFAEPRRIVRDGCVASARPCAAFWARIHCARQLAARQASTARALDGRDPGRADFAVGWCRGLARILWPFRCTSSRCHVGCGPRARRSRYGGGQIASCACVVRRMGGGC